MKVELREWLIVWGKSVFMVLMGLFAIAFVIYGAIS